MLAYKGRAVKKPPEKKPVYPREAYMKAYPFLNELRQHRQILPHQALATLRGQALSGDLDGAMKGLGRLLGRAYERGYKEGN